MKNALETVSNDNITGAKAAAIITAGGVANTQLIKLISKKAPLAARGYINTPIGKLAVANVASIAIKQARPGDKQLEALAEGMIVSAYQEVLNSFDINSIIDDFLDQAPIKSAIAGI